MYYQSKSTAFLLIFCCLNVLEATENLSNDEMDYLAGKVSVKDELLIEDEQLALAHIDMDIKDFEDLEKTINYLREQIRQHSDNHIVNQSELVKADNILRRVEDDEIHLSLLELKSLKKEILAMKHRISNTSINHINFIVEGAEQFLSKSLTDVTEIVRENVKWTSEEEKERIIDMVFHPKTNFSQPMIKKIYSSNATSNNQAKYPSKMSEGLKASLENAKIVIKKIKEEKQLRHPVQGIVNKTENVEGKKIETETIQKPLQTKFEEEKSNNIKATEHVKIDNKTIDAFNVAKDGSHKFIDKVFHRDSEKNVQVLFKLSKIT